MDEHRIIQLLNVIKKQVVESDCTNTEKNNIRNTIDDFINEALEHKKPILNIYAVEFGYKQCESGVNLEQALSNWGEK